MRALTPTASNFRAEIARHRLAQTELARIINMNPATLSQHVNGQRALSDAARHNIAWGIQQMVGRSIFSIDYSEGLIPLKMGRPRSRSRLRKVQHYPLYPMPA